MKRLLCMAVLYAGTAGAAFAGGETAAAFEKIKALEGEWHGTLPDGKPITITYEKINGGAMVERYRSTDPMWWNMSSAYHLDNGRILMTHYCSWGNHPRMSAHPSGGQPDELAFAFLDIAENRPDNGYMRNVTFEFEDENRLKHHWTWREDGKETPLTLTLERSGQREK